MAQHVVSLAEGSRAFEKKQILQFSGIVSMNVNKIKLVDSLVILSVAEKGYKTIQL